MSPVQATTLKLQQRNDNRFMTETDRLIFALGILQSSRQGLSPPEDASLEDLVRLRCAFNVDDKVKDSFNERAKQIATSSTHENLTEGRRERLVTILNSVENDIGKWLGKRVTQGCPTCKGNGNSCSNCKLGSFVYSSEQLEQLDILRTADFGPDGLSVTTVPNMASGDNTVEGMGTVAYSSQQIMIGWVHKLPPGHPILRLPDDDYQQSQSVAWRGFYRIPKGAIGGREDRCVVLGFPMAHTGQARPFYWLRRGVLDLTTSFRRNQLELEYKRKQRDEREALESKRYLEEKALKKAQKELPTDMALVKAKMAEQDAQIAELMKTIEKLTK